MIEDVERSDDAEAYVRSVLDGGGRLMGYVGPGTRPVSQVAGAAAIIQEDR
jgi:hypothetical protein